MSPKCVVPLAIRNQKPTTNHRCQRLNPYHRSRETGSTDSTTKTAHKTNQSRTGVDRDNTFVDESLQRAQRVDADERGLERSLEVAAGGEIANVDRIVDDILEFDVAKAKVVVGGGGCRLQNVIDERSLRHGRWQPVRIGRATF